MLDCGANANFLSFDYAERWGLIGPQKYGQVELADGRKAKREAQLSKVVNLNISGPRERVQFVITNLKNGPDLLLGMPWLQSHNPAVNWATKELTLLCAGKRFVFRNERLQPEQTISQRPRIQQVSLIKFIQDCKAPTTKAFLFLIRASTITLVPPSGQTHSTEMQELLSKFKDVLVDGLLHGLPPRHAVDHRIELLDENAKPPHRPCYRMSIPELEVPSTGQRISRQRLCKAISVPQ